MIRTTLIACAASIVMGQTGCNVDMMVRHQQPPPGPVVPIGNPPGIELPTIREVGVAEVDLVENVLAHRALYRRYLAELHDYYIDHGYVTQGDWAAFELADVDRIKAFHYLLDAEVPAATLTASESIAEADELFARGKELMQQGGHGLPIFYGEERMREALKVFVSLIEQYPRSDKIDDAAFYCGEIHNDYLEKQEPLAVRWYERAFTWNPNTPHPARFRAAVTYDYRLGNRRRALELYREVLRSETDSKANLAFATRRIGKLTADPG